MTRKTLAELAALCGAALEGDGSIEVTGPAALSEAGPDHVSFLAHPRYVDQLGTTRAAAVLVAEDVQIEREGLNLLRHPDPDSAFNLVVLAFRPQAEVAEVGIHPTAVVDPRARVAEDVSVGPLCTVGADAVVGPNVVLHPGVHLGSGVHVGRGSVIHSGVVLYPGVTVGEDCTLHAGAVLGSDGFGFKPSDGGWLKVPQCGTVEVGDNVEIGANCAIDRGRFGATRIGSGTKLDNLVHVAHNVQVGENALLIAQVGVAGSSKVGKNAILAGQVGLSGHLEVGDGARVGPASAIFKDIPAGEDWFGSPAEPRTSALRRMARQRRLGDMIERLRKLESRLGAAEAGAESRGEGA